MTPVLWAPGNGSTFDRNPMTGSALVVFVLFSSKSISERVHAALGKDN